MQYLTGKLAFGIPCDLNSVGAWNFTKDMWLDNKLIELKESRDSILKDFGIEGPKLVPHREYTVYNVANHLRAYMDLLIEGRFDELTGVFEQYINSPQVRTKIFILVTKELRNQPNKMEIHDFLAREFGNSWISYLHGLSNMNQQMMKLFESVDREVRGLGNAKSVSARKGASV